MSHIASQLSNDWDPDPDVRESRGAFKPARGAAMFSAGCWVSGVNLTLFTRGVTLLTSYSKYFEVITSFH